MTLHKADERTLEDSLERKLWKGAPKVPPHWDTDDLHDIQLSATLTELRRYVRQARLVIVESPKRSAPVPKRRLTKVLKGQYGEQIISATLRGTPGGTLIITSQRIGEIWIQLTLF